MDRVRAIAREAQRRTTAATILEAAGHGAAIGAGIGVLAAGVGAALDWPVGWWWLAVGPIAAGLAIGASWALRRRPSLLNSAARLDATLGLKDRVSTGLALSTTDGDAFAALARDEAESAGARASVKAAVPLRVGPAWAWTGVLAGLAVCTGVYLPKLDLLGFRGRAEAAERGQQARLAMAREIAEVTQAQTPEPAGTPGEQARADQLAALDEIRGELEAGRITAEEAAQQASNRLDDLAGRAEERAERIRREQEALRERLGAAGQSRSNPVTGDGRLGRALSGADVDATKAAADELAALSERATPEQREAVARELEELAQALKTPAGSATPQGAGEGGAGTAEEAMVEQGVPPEESQRIAAELDRQAAEKALERLGVPAETARALAERLARSRQDRQAQERADEEARELSEAASDAAEELRRPPASGGSPRQGPPQSQPEREPRAASDPGATADTARPPTASSAQAELGSRSKNPTQPPSPPEPPAPRTPDATAQPPADRSTSASERSPKPGAESASPRSDPSAGTAPERQTQPQPSSNGASESTAQPPRSEGDASPTGSGTPAQSQAPSSPTTADQPKASKDPTARDQSRSESQQNGQPAERGATPEARPEPPQNGVSRQDASGSKGAQRQQPAPAPASESPQPGGARAPQAQPRQPGPPPPSNASAPGPGQEAKTPATSSSAAESSTRNGAPQERPGQPSGEGEQSPGGVQRFAERLRRLAEQRREGQQEARRAEDLREQARRMAERLTPEQRRDLENWARRQPSGSGERPQGSRDSRGGEAGEPSGRAVGQPGNGPDRESGRNIAGNQPGRAPGAAAPSPAFTRTDPVDARARPVPGSTPRERVAAEWLGEGSKDGHTGTSEAQEVFRAAQRSAERAVDDRAVPARFDRLLERYFRRLPERAAGVQPAPVPATDAPRPAEDAK